MATFSSFRGGGRFSLLAQGKKAIIATFLIIYSAPVINIINNKYKLKCSCPAKPPTDTPVRHLFCNHRDLFWHFDGKHFSTRPAESLFITISSGKWGRRRAHTHTLHTVCETRQFKLHYTPPWQIALLITLKTADSILPRTNFVNQQKQPALIYCPLNFCPRIKVAGVCKIFNHLFKFHNF